MEKLIHGTADFKAQKKAFDESLLKFKVVSSRDILYDNQNELVEKINLSLSMWCHTSSTKYLINYLSEKLGFIYNEADIEKICVEIDKSSDASELSEEVATELYEIADKYISYCETEFEKLEDTKYRKTFEKSLDRDTLVHGFINHDEKFFMEYIASVFNMSEDELNRFYTHVFKRRSVNYFDKNEFLVWLSAKIATDFNYAVLCELKDLYSGLKKSNKQKAEASSIDIDITDTYCIGENVEEIFLSDINSDVSYKEVRENPVINKVLIWHINLPAHKESSAGKRFRELFEEVNELYKDEISDEITARRSDVKDEEKKPKNKKEKIKEKKEDTDEKQDENGEEKEKVEYKKVRTLPKVKLTYSLNKNLSVNALRPVFYSKGKFNRVEGINEFGFAEDTVLPAGNHVLEVEAKFVSERPFQMERLRKSGMIEVAASSKERKSGKPLPEHILRVNDEFAKNFSSITVYSEKPICIPATEFNLGDIRAVLFSPMNKVTYSDVIGEQMIVKDEDGNEEGKITVAKLIKHNERKIPVNVDYLKSEWFLRTIINDEIIKNYENVDGYEQRSAFELMLFLKFIKEELNDETDKMKIEKNFMRTMNYELEQVRFEGIHMGNPFDLLLTYLIKMEEPDVMLNALYAEVFTNGK